MVVVGGGVSWFCRVSSGRSGNDGRAGAAVDSEVGRSTGRGGRWPGRGGGARGDGSGLGLGVLSMDDSPT